MSFSSDVWRTEWGKNVTHSVSESCTQLQSCKCALKTEYRNELRKCRPFLSEMNDVKTTPKIGFRYSQTIVYCENAEIPPHQQLQLFLFLVFLHPSRSDIPNFCV